MVTLRIMNSKDPDFIALVKLLDADLKIRDGKEHDFYAQFNGIEDMELVIVAYRDQTPIGCGALKGYNNNSMEIKRMFVMPQERGKGIASMILKTMEKWAKNNNVSSCLLETGLRQPEAIALYKKNNYVSQPNYGPYKEMANSVCFIKKL